MKNMQATLDTPKPLSAREIEVLQHAANGNSSKEIAAHLKVEYVTIITHRNNILRKLSAKSFTHAVAMGFRNNLIE